MSTPDLRLLQSTSSNVAVLLVSGTSEHPPILDIGALRTVVGDLPERVQVVGVVTTPDEVLDGLISRVLAEEVEIAARGVAVTEAVKEVDGNVVVRAVDRTTLRRVVGPEVADRSALEEALRNGDPASRTTLTELVVRAGGRVGVFED